MPDEVVVPTPAPATPPPAPAPVDSLKNSFFKSLQLTVDDAGKVTAPEGRSSTIGQPDPDTGVPVTPKEEFSPNDGSMADLIRSIKLDAAKAEANPPPAPAPTPEPAKPVEPVAAAPTPTPEPTKPAEPKPSEVPQIKLHAIDAEAPTPQLIHDDGFLPLVGLDLSGFDEDELEEIRSAAFAESKYPQRYTGHTKRTVEWIKKHKDFVAAKAAENPDDDISTDSRYLAWTAANKPKVTDTERRRLERERLIDEAAKQADTRAAARQAKLEQELYKLRAIPAIEKSTDEFKQHIDAVLPIDDSGVSKVVCNQIKQGAITAGREFLSLANQVTQFDSANPTHKWLSDFIKQQGDSFAASKHAATKRGAQTFLPRAEYNSLPAAERAKHFTFTNEEVMQLIAMEARRAAEFGIAAKRKELEEMGYTPRQAAALAASPATPPAAPTPPPPADVSPRASVSVAPAAPAPAPKRDSFLSFVQVGR